MACVSGTKVVDEGLIFNLDLNNSDKSFKGRPTTNLIGQHDFGFSEGALTGWTLSDPALTAEFTGYLGEPCVKLTRPAGNAGYDGFRSAISPNMAASTQYTISVEYAVPVTMDQALRIYIPERNSSGTVISWNHYITPKNATDGWVRSTRTFTTNADGATWNPLHIDWHTTASTTDDVVYIKAIQVEQGPVATRFTSGTRDSTGVLRDITGNYSLSVSNLEYQDDGIPYFDGVDSSISLVDAGDFMLNRANDFTVEFWIKPDDVYSRFITPLSHGIDHWIGYDNTSERIEVIICQGADQTSRAIRSNTNSVPYGNWSHVSVSIVGQSVYIWVNGELQKQYTESAFTIATWIGSWSIGQRGNNTGFLSGYLDGLKLYNRKLTDDEVRANFKSKQSRVSYKVKHPTRDLVLHYDVADTRCWTGSGTLTNLASTTNTSTSINYGNVTSAIKGGALALNFDTVGKWFMVTFSSDLFINTGNATLEAWIYPEAIISSGDRSTILQTSGARNAYLSVNKSNNKLSSYWYDKSPAGYHESGAAMALNQWHHICGVWNEAEGKLYQYTNGIRTEVTTSGIPSSGGYYLLIGREGNSRQFSGGMAIIKVYDTALTQQEVLDSFHKDRARFL